MNKKGDVLMSFEQVIQKNSKFARVAFSMGTKKYKKIRKAKSERNVRFGEYKNIHILSFQFNASIFLKFKIKTNERNVRR